MALNLLARLAFKSASHAAIVPELQPQVCVGLVRIREKQRLTKFVHAKFADHFLSGSVSHEFHERHRALIIDFRPLIRIDRDHMINIEQGLITFDKN